MSSTITPEQWDQRKEEILRLYIDEGWALKPVMRAMRSDDFHPTESQYRTKLKKWKRRKPRNSHAESADIQPSNPHTPVSQPVESVPEGYPPSMTWRGWSNQAQDQIRPSTVENFDPAMLPNQTSFGWHDGLVAPLADEPPAVQATTPDQEHGGLLDSDNAFYQSQDDSTFFDPEEFKARAKKMAADKKLGNPGHSRVQVVQRRRRYSPSQQHPGNTPQFQGIGQTSLLFKVPHSKEPLPAIPPMTMGSFPPDIREIGEKKDAWWHPDLTADTASKMPRETTFEEAFLDL